MKDILIELNCQKDQNGLMHNKISELQTNIVYIQVPPSFKYFISLKL